MQVLMLERYTETSRENAKTRLNEIRELIISVEDRINPLETVRQYMKEIYELAIVLDLVPSDDEIMFGKSDGEMPVGIIHATRPEEMFFHVERAHFTEYEAILQEKKKPNWRRNKKFWERH